MRARSPLLFGAVALAVVYAGLIAALRPGAFITGDEGIVFLQVDSIWRHAWTSLAVDPPSANLDPAGDFLPASLLPPRGPAGPVRSSLPSVLPLVASVPYALLGIRGAYLIPALAALICMAAAARLAGLAMEPESTEAAKTQASWWPALAGVGAVAASPLVVHGATLQSGALAAALATAGLIPLCKKSAGGGGAFASGLLLGLAAAADPQAAPMILAAAAAGALAWGARAFAPRGLAMLGGAGLVLALRALYHRAVFGSYLPHHVLAALVGSGDPAHAGSVPARLGAAADLLLPSAGGAAVAVAAILLAGALLVPPARRWMLASLPAGMIAAAGVTLWALILVGGPLLAAALELEAAGSAPGDRVWRGLAASWPLLAMAPIAALQPAGKISARLRFLGWAGGLFIALTLLRGGVADGPWGPGAFLASLPGLTVAIVGAVAARGRGAGGRLALACLWITLGSSVVLQGVGLRHLVATRAYNASVLERVRSAVPEGEVILTDLRAVPQMLAPLSRDTPALWVAPGSDLEALTGRLEDRNITPFWIVRSGLTKDEADHAPLKAAGRGASRAAQVDLGGGLSLARGEQEAGVRGFFDIPRGD